MEPGGLNVSHGRKWQKTEGHTLPKPQKIEGYTLMKWQKIEGHTLSERQKIEDETLCAICDEMVEGPQVPHAALLCDECYYALVLVDWEPLGAVTIH